MADKLKRYQELQDELNRVREELESLEQSPEIRRDLEFKRDLQQFINEQGYTLPDVYRVLFSDEAQPTPGKAESGRTRALQVYKNPETGEVVKTRGGNQKTLNEWREEYGAETVRSWRVE